MQPQLPALALARQCGADSNSRSVGRPAGAICGAALAAERKSGGAASGPKLIPPATVNKAKQKQAVGDGRRCLGLAASEIVVVVVVVANLWRQTRAPIFRRRLARDDCRCRGRPRQSGPTRRAAHATVRAAVAKSRELRATRKPSFVIYWRPNELCSLTFVRAARTRSSDVSPPNGRLFQAPESRAAPAGRPAAGFSLKVSLFGARREPKKVCRQQNARFELALRQRFAVVIVLQRARLGLAWRNTSKKLTKTAIKERERNVGVLARQPASQLAWLAIKWADFDSQASHHLYAAAAAAAKKKNRQDAQQRSTKRCAARVAGDSRLMDVTTPAQLDSRQPH